MNKIFPISFSIPEEKIVNIIPNKNNILANYIPNGVGHANYIYDNEEDYYNGYKNSLFAITKKKGGWDAMRHYEIMASGCIPVFENLENCPITRIFNFPKKIILESNNFFKIIINKYNIHKNNNSNQLSEEELNKCYYYINLLLNYTREHLISTKIAKYILEKTENSYAKNILYICNPPDGDYLRSETLHGFKKLFGKNCVEYPFMPHIYKLCNKNKNHNFDKMHGKGFSYTKLLDIEEYYNEKNEEEIINLIKNNYFDIVIYSSLHHNKPNHEHILFNIVKEYYPPNKIIFLCGEDEHRNQPGWLTPVCIYPEFIKKGHYCFVREL